METTIANLLEQAAKNNNGIIFFDRNGNKEWLSYKELQIQAIKLLGGLQNAGLTPGSYVVFQFADNLNFLISFWGCILGGFLPVPLPVCADDEKSQKLLNVLALLESPYILTEEYLFPCVHKFASVNAKLILLCEKMCTANMNGKVYNAQPSDLAMIQFSSGSTGQPKGVQLTQRNIVSNVHSIVKAAGFHSDDTVLSWLPLTHDMGLIGAHITAVLLNINQYIMQTELFMRRPQLWFDKISEYGITVTLAPNFAYKLILSLLNGGMQPNWNLEKLRFILNGAEPISADVCTQFLKATECYGMRSDSILNVYGMAEASLAVAFSSPGEKMEYTYFDRNSLSIGSYVQKTARTEQSVAIVNVGTAVPDCEIRIADEKNNVLSDGIVGEIQLSGTGITVGYYKGNELNDILFTSDGWLHTGDIGFIYEGKLYISGRSKEILFVNGQNYYPYDIEEMIEHKLALPSGSTAVCGVQDKQSGRDCVCVFIEHTDDSEFQNLTANLRQMLMKNMKLYADEVIPVEKLPRTVSGKIQRVALRMQIEAQQSLKKNIADSSPHQPVLLTQTEAILTELCQSCLFDNTCTAIGQNDSFMEIGLDSVKLVQFAEKISTKFGKKIDVTDLFANPTIHDMALFLDRKSDLQMPCIQFLEFERKCYNDAKEGCVCFNIPDYHMTDCSDMVNAFSDALKGLCKNDQYSFHCMCDTQGIIDHYEYKDSLLILCQKLHCEELSTAKFSDPQAYSCILYDSESNRNNQNMLRVYDIVAVYQIRDHDVRFDIYHSAYAETKLILELVQKIQACLMTATGKECVYA